MNTLAHQRRENLADERSCMPTWVEHRGLDASLLRSAAGVGSLPLASARSSVREPIRVRSR